MKKLKYKLCLSDLLWAAELVSAEGQGEIPRSRSIHGHPVVSILHTFLYPSHPHDHLRNARPLSLFLLWEATELDPIQILEAFTPLGGTLERHVSWKRSVCVGRVLHCLLPLWGVLAVSGALCTPNMS